MKQKLFTAASFHAQRMNHRALARISVLAVPVIAFALVSATPALAEEKGLARKEMRLNLVNSNQWTTAIHPDSGWQLTVDMQAKDRFLLGIGVEWFPHFFQGPKRPAFWSLTTPITVPR